MKQKTYYLPHVYALSTQHWGYQAAQTQPSLIPDKRQIGQEEEKEQERKKRRRGFNVYETFFHDTVRA